MHNKQSQEKAFNGCFRLLVVCLSGIEAVRASSALHRSALWRISEEVPHGFTTTAVSPI